MADPHPAKDAGSAGRGELIEKFGATPTRLIGTAAIALAALVCVDLARDGLSAGDMVAVSLVVFGATALWMILVRPRLTAYKRVLLIHNIASEIELPWQLVEGAEARQTLRVYAKGEVFHAVGIVKTTRQMVQAGRGPLPGSMMGGRTGTPQLRHGPSDVPSGYFQDQVAERLMQIAHGQRAVPGGPDQVVRLWALPEIALLCLSALAFLVSALG